MSGDRYWLCDDTCTTDCGACKGAGRPVTAAAGAGPVDVAGLLADLEAKHAVATPGPWIQAERGDGQYVAGDFDGRFCTDLAYCPESPADAALIAAMHAALPALLRLARAGEALRTDVLALVEEWDRQHADWCCQRGCPHYQSVHPGPVEFTTDAGIVPLGPDFPCPGECTCYVGPFRDRLRGVVAATEEGQ